ncbi:hypothetical protein GGR57DRAFT_512308 [Xylariaceae sp. FL1272]|nr:hypothetical protein GGR57DRAFT_512308 [Xylariaceae sp. FL1272]
MCKIIAVVEYSCGHSEPCVNLRTCQFKSVGTHKSRVDDPLCLLYSEAKGARFCWLMGRVRTIQATEKKMVCAACYTANVDKRDLPAVDKKKMIHKALMNAEFHASRAKELITESEKSARLESPDISEVTAIALSRLSKSFEDPDLTISSCAELLQIIMGLPLVNKHLLVMSFAIQLGKKSGNDKKVMTDFYELSKTKNDWGEAFCVGWTYTTAVFKKGAK